MALDHGRIPETGKRYTPRRIPKTRRVIVLCTSVGKEATEQYWCGGNSWTTDVTAAHSLSDVEHAISLIRSPSTQYVCDYEIYGKKVEVRGTWYAQN